MKLISSEKVNIIKGVLEDKKALDIEVLDVKDITSIADYFVICTGLNKRHIMQLGDYLVEELNKYNEKKMRENKSEQWILMDFNDVIVHIFQEEERQRINLEKLWTKDSTEPKDVI